MMKSQKAVSGESHWANSWRMLRHNRMGMIGLCGLALLCLITILAPWIAPYNPTEMDYTQLRKPPSSAHLFGTDDLGRDVFSRVLWGGRDSMRVGFVAVAIGVSGGVVVGLVSGWYGGKVDSLIQRIAEIVMAFPSILLLLSIVAVLGPSLNTALIAIGLSDTPYYARLVRGSVMSAKNFDYIMAARVTGATSWRIMFRHILPNVMAPTIVYATLGLGGSIMILAGLSFLGLGAQPPSPEWGAMLLYGRDFIERAWWMSVFPGAAVMAAVLTINLLGDGLRDALDPKLRA